MFNGHKIYLIFDVGQIAGIINNFDMMMVAAIASDYPNHSNIYNAGILMPPTEILMKWADGDPYIMNQQYPQYLSSKDPTEMITALLAALTKKDIYLYIPMDEFKIFGTVLLQHLYYIWGITVDDMMSSGFHIDETKIPYIISMFYMLDVMEPQVYMDMYPWNYQLPDFVIPKLAEDFKPFAYPVSFNDYKAYFNNMNAQSNRSQPVEMVRMLGGGSI